MAPMIEPNEGTMALNFVPDNWPSVRRLGPEDAEVRDPMSPYERRPGNEFPGLLIPFGAGVRFRPPTHVIKASHKFAQHTRLGAFLGWVTTAGGKWHGDYLVADVEDALESDYGCRTVFHKSLQLWA